MSETVLMTGAGIGIGRATAKAFAKAGHTVVATDVLEKEGAAVAGEIVREGGKAEFHKLDVRSSGAADAVVAAAEKTYGGIDVIVANAGIAHRVPLSGLTIREVGPYFRNRPEGHAARHSPGAAGHEAKERGAIVCVSSIMGVAYGWDEHVHYSSAKAGVVGLVRGLGVELRKHRHSRERRGAWIHRTAQLLSKEHSLGPKGAEAAGAFIPMGRIGEPAEHRRRHFLSRLDGGAVHDRASGRGRWRTSRWTY